MFRFLFNIGLATTIFLTRYNKKNYSKFFIRFFSKFFCNHILVIDRYKRLKNNNKIHQTEIAYDLIKECKINLQKKSRVNLNLPDKKISIIPNNKKLVTIHIPDRWINNYYND